MAFAFVSCSFNYFVSCTSSSLQSLPRPKRSNHFVNFHSDQLQSVTIVTRGGKTSLMDHTAPNSGDKETMQEHSLFQVSGHRHCVTRDRQYSITSNAKQLNTFQYNYCNQQTTELRNLTRFYQAPPNFVKRSICLQNH